MEQPSQVAPFPVNRRVGQSRSGATQQPIMRSVEDDSVRSAPRTAMYGFPHQNPSLPMTTSVPEYLTPGYTAQTTPTSAFDSGSQVPSTTLQLPRYPKVHVGNGVWRYIGEYQEKLAQQVIVNAGLGRPGNYVSADRFHEIAVAKGKSWQSDLDSFVEFVPSPNQYSLPPALVVQAPMSYNFLPEVEDPDPMLSQPILDAFFEELERRESGRNSAATPTDYPAFAQGSSQDAFNQVSFGGQDSAFSNVKDNFKGKANQELGGSFGGSSSNEGGHPSFASIPPGTLRGLGNYAAQAAPFIVNNVNDTDGTVAATLGERMEDKGPYGAKYSNYDRAAPTKSMFQPSFGSDFQLYGDENLSDRSRVKHAQSGKVGRSGVASYGFGFDNKVNGSRTQVSAAIPKGTGISAGEGAMVQGVQDRCSSKPAPSFPAQPTAKGKGKEEVEQDDRTRYPWMYDEDLNNKRLHEDFPNFKSGEDW